MKQWKNIIKISLITFCMGNSLSGQAGPPDPIERISVSGHGQWSGTTTSYEGYPFASWGDYEGVSRNDEDKAENQFKMCKGNVEKRYRSCRTSTLKSHVNTMEGECSYKSVVQGGANGIVVNVSLSRDEYTMCKDVAEANREYSLSGCELVKATVMADICNDLPGQ